MPIVIDSEYLEVNGVPLSTAAWRITDLSPLFDAPAVRGDDLLIPYRVGLKPKPRRVTARRIALPISVFGDYDADGNHNADGRIGLAANLDYLIGNLGFGLEAGDGTVPAVWHRPDGSTKTADVHVIGPLEVVPLGPIAVRGVLDLNVPAGRFV